jgi:hypothetical protein
MRKPILTFLILTVLKINAQVIEHFKYKGKDAEIIILPSDFVIPESLTYVSKLRSGDPYSAPYKPTYTNQLHRLCVDAFNDGANVILINKIVNVKWRDEFNIKGRSFNTADYEAFKNEIFRKKDSIKKLLINYADIIVYRPDYTQSFNDLTIYHLIIGNDTISPMRNSKYKIRVEEEGKTDIKIIGSNTTLPLDIKFGKTYYLCTYAGASDATMQQPRINSISVSTSGYTPQIIITEEEKGEIESSLIKFAP